MKSYLKFKTRNKELIFVLLLIFLKYFLIGSSPYIRWSGREKHCKPNCYDFGKCWYAGSYEVSFFLSTYKPSDIVGCCSKLIYLQEYLIHCFCRKLFYREEVHFYAHIYIKIKEICEGSSLISKRTTKHLKSFFEMSHQPKMNPISFNWTVVPCLVFQSWILC